MLFSTSKIDSRDEIKNTNVFRNTFILREIISWLSIKVIK
jgi:hypothetical protein